MEAVSTMVVDGKVPSREAEGRNGRVGVRKRRSKDRETAGRGRREGWEGWMAA